MGRKVFNSAELNNQWIQIWDFIYAPNNPQLITENYLTLINEIAFSYYYPIDTRRCLAESLKRMQADYWMDTAEYKLN